MGRIKDKNITDLTKAEDIKKKWQEYKEIYKEGLHDPDNHDGMITHLELSRHPGMRSPVGLRKHHYKQN